MTVPCGSRWRRTGFLRRGAPPNRWASVGGGKDCKRLQHTTRSVARPQPTCRHNVAGNKRACRDIQRHTGPRWTRGRCTLAIRVIPHTIPATASVAIAPFGHPRGQSTAGVAPCVLCVHTGRGVGRAREWLIACACVADGGTGGAQTERDSHLDIRTGAGWCVCELRQLTPRSGFCRLNPAAEGGRTRAHVSPSVQG